MEVVVYLAEVEERRLHLKSGYSSLFAYCVGAHAMSEDEACRRIEVARLGRRFPRVFSLLASGAVSLSVLALVKTYLTDDNEEALLGAMSGKSVTAARRELAARFPKPDVPSLVRKLPNGRVGPFLPPQPPLEGSNRSIYDDRVSTRASRAEGDKDGTIAGGAPSTVGGPAVTKAKADSIDDPGLPESTRDVADSVQVPSSCSVSNMDGPIDADVTPPAADQFRHRARIEPLSAVRYKVQFTASAQLKAKLEFARDLMAHRNPGLDLAPVIERALDFLIEKLLKQRAGSPEGSPAPSQPRTACKEPGRTPSRSVKRAVVLRDGLRCAFVAPDGKHCDSMAFLEFDHRMPAGKGGSSEQDNIRMLCRAHNRLVAEEEYGREKIVWSIQSAQRPRPREA